MHGMLRLSPKDCLACPGWLGSPGTGWQVARTSKRVSGRRRDGHHKKEHLGQRIHRTPLPHRRRDGHHKKEHLGQRIHRTPLPPQEERRPPQERTPRSTYPSNPPPPTGGEAATTRKNTSVNVSIEPPTPTGAGLRRVAFFKAGFLVFIGLNQSTILRCGFFGFFLFNSPLFCRFPAKIRDALLHFANIYS